MSLEIKNIFRDRFKISEKRLEICNTCEEFDKTFRKCRKCGCFMDAKTLFMDAECPLGKWKHMAHNPLVED